MNRKLLELVPSSSRTPILLFLTFFISSLLLSPSQSISTLYSPQQSSLYEPPSQPRSGPRIKYSIIVPTYHERDNIRPLVTTVFDTLPFDKARETEIIIVDDDSEDSTEEEVEKLKEEGREVSILVRRRVNGKGERGLSSAVLRGFERARGSKLLVMDADLQHPAAFIAPLFDALTDETPFAIGTRYGKGVSMSRDWPMYRRIISWGARMLARPLTSASDPMSGFFAIQKDLFLRSLPINPLGFKIALELLLKTPLPSHGLIEVPYSFATRTLGSSKLGASTILKYVAQLITLYVWKWGFFWHLLVAGGGTVGVVGLRKVLVKIWPHADSAKLRGGRKLFGRSSTGAVCALDPNSHHISTFFTSKMPPPRRTAAQQKRLANAARPRPHTDPTAQANTTTAFRRQLQELRRPEPEEPCDLWQHRCHPSPVDHPEMTEEERDVWAAKWDSHIQRFFSVGRGSRSVLTGLDALPITLHSEAALEYFRTVKKQCHETRFMLTAFVEKFRIKKGPDDFAVFWAKQSVAARRRMATDAFFEMCKVHEQEEAIRALCPEPLNEVFDAPTQSIESHPATLQPQIEYLKDHPDVHYVLFRKPSRPPFEIRIHFVMDMHKGAYNMAMLWARDCDPRAVAYLYSLLVMNIVDETVEKELKHQMAKEYGVDMDMGASLGFPDQSEMPELLRKYVLPNMDGDDDAKRAAFKVQNAVSPSFSESCPFEDLQFARQKYAELEEVLASKARGENPDVPNWLADFMLERRQRGD
ncbi:dolichol-phosphate mannosyltransferase, partial [Phenoliferia sp. Uapishka_3]